MSPISSSSVATIRHEPLPARPSAIIWHDKADFSRRLTPSKIELEDAHLRLIRDSKGKWNVEGITKPANEGEQAPVLLLKKMHVEVIDQKLGSSAVIDIQEMDVTVINDPATVYNFEAKGKANPIGPFFARGRFEASVGANGNLDLGSIKLGDDLARWSASRCRRRLTS